MKIILGRADDGRLRSGGFSALLLSIVVYFCLAPAPVMGGEGRPVAGGANRGAAASAPRMTQSALWPALIERGRGKSRWEMLRTVNDYFNRLTPAEDAQHWGRADYWATPEELLASGAGDCEDFAIAKYFALRDMGIAAGDLRIIYVERRPDRAATSEPHMVLGYQQHDGPLLILDNLTGDITPLTRRTDLMPVYAFNGDGVWLWRDGQEPLLLGAPAQLTQWRELLARI